MLNDIIQLGGAAFFIAGGLALIFARDTVWRIYNGGVEPRKPEQARTPGWDQSVDLIGKVLLVGGLFILLQMAFP